MNGTHLEGLQGNNPLGFLAAIGVQVAFEGDAEQPRLWWTDDLTPHAVVDGAFSLERIVNRASQVFPTWHGSSSANPRRSDGSTMPKGDEMKLEPKDIRAYLETSRGSTSRLASALVAEGSLDRQGVAKPTDLYFTAGQMKFLDMARKILAAVTHADLQAGLEGPWPYESTLPSLGWDVADDRIYAMRASDPSSEKKSTNPGPEALAILGMTRYPVFAGRDRTLTPGFSGTWKAGRFSWPLWSKPAAPASVTSLLAHAYYDSADTSQRWAWFPAWGVFTVLACPVLRSGQGGYGTFAPAEVVWRTEAEAG